MSVQSVETAVVAEADKVVAEVKELFLIEKNHLQAFLNYLSGKPYAEVYGLIDAMKTATVAPPQTSVGAPVSITQTAPAATVVAPVAASSDAGVTSSS
jgi:hypothetical protein